MSRPTVSIDLGDMGRAHRTLVVIVEWGGPLGRFAQRFIVLAYLNWPELPVRLSFKDRRDYVEQERRDKLVAG